MSSSIPFTRKNTSSPSYPTSEASDSSSENSIDRDEESAMIQAEWEESLRQVEMILSIVIIPFFGKWWGRKWAYWAWERYSNVGLGKAFFGRR